jgi:aerobic carbon-monoxide dehydrogenase large subunit
MPQSSWVGAPLRRREDLALLTGGAVFAADPRPPGLCHLAVVRSPLPCARIRGIGLDEARGMPGVLAAWSAADLPELGTLAGFSVPGLELRPRPVLARELTHYAGEPLAVVVAGEASCAEDAAARVLLDLEAVEATADPLRGQQAGEVHRTFGDPEAAFASAGVVVRADLRLARVAGGYLEPRAVTAEPDGDGVTVRTSTQWAHGVRDAVAAALRLEASKVRVLATNVGGAFGAKGMPYPEEVLVALAALRLGRAVKWTGDRSEDTLATAQSHGTILDLELAASETGELLGLRGRIVHPIGAYAASGPGQADNIASHLISCYRLPALDVTVELRYTNTVPSGFVRGGGREVGNFAIERLMDRLARRLGLDPVEVRRRNLVQPLEMPYDTGYRSPRGLFVYDGGDYPAMLEEAVHAIEAAPRGAATGLGVVCFAESTGIGAPETARIAISPDGAATVYVGTTPQGQGHLTAAAQVAAENLGWPYEAVDVVAGDSASVPMSMNTAASRSAVEMGGATARAARSARARLLDLAANVLEADPADIEIGPAGAAPRGVPERAVALERLIPEGLEISETYDPERRRPYAAGCAVTLVDVDVETGEVRVRNQVLVHDIGRAINPRIVEGQTHGAYAHGLGYALYEEVAHAPDATPLTSGFLDYAIVTAAEVTAEPDVREHNTPSLHSAEGFRGAGEGGTIPIPAAIASAVEDSLRRQGVDVFVHELPITPQRLHALIEEASHG